MNAKHTPGPWIASMHATAKGTPFGIVTGGAGPRKDTVICYAPDFRDEQRSFEAFRDANAALIAAAPDLLSALQRLLSCDIEENRNITGSPGAIAAARAAIKSATGA